MITRRQFLATGFTASLANLANAQAPREAKILRLERLNFEVNGRPASMVGIRQPDGFLGIKMPSNEPFVARVENHTGEPSLIHWHGLEVPWRQDGVPGISAPAIQPGGDAHYDFSFRQQGTYWMHSHYGLQLQSLMAAPFIITDPSNREREIVNRPGFAGGRFV